MKKEFINALIDSATINKDNLKDFLVHVNDSYDFNIEAFILSIIGKRKMLYSTCDDLNNRDFTKYDTEKIYSKILDYCSKNVITITEENKIDVTTFYYMRQEVYFCVGEHSYYLNLLD